MSTRILYKNAVVSEDELAEAYCRLSYNLTNKHVAPWTPARFDAEYIAYVENGRSRRDGKYGHLSYGVVEIGWV